MFAQSCDSDKTVKLLKLKPESHPLKYDHINARSVTGKLNISKVSSESPIASMVTFVDSKLSVISLNVTVGSCV